MLSLAALECGVDTVLAAEPLGGMAALRAKSLGADASCSPPWSRRAAPATAWCSSRRATTRSAAARCCLAHPTDGYAIVQALIARGVVGDFRAGDGAPCGRAGHPALRLHAAVPRFVDVWDAVEHLRQVLDSGEWREERFTRRAAVT